MVGLGVQQKYEEAHDRNSYRYIIIIFSTHGHLTPSQTSPGFYVSTVQVF